MLFNFWVEFPYLLILCYKQRKVKIALIYVSPHFLPCGAGVSTSFSNSNIFAYFHFDLNFLHFTSNFSFFSVTV